MDHGKFCHNHPDRRSLSLCHGCAEYYCAECLTEGKTFYYCFKPHCQSLMQLDPKIANEEIEESAPLELETIATYKLLYQAEIARGRLEAEGIIAFLADENMNSLYSVGGIRLRVASEDALLAREILTQVESGEDSFVDSTE